MVAGTFDPHVGAGGKNGVQMSGKQYNSFGVRTGPLRDYVAGVIDSNSKTFGLEELFEELATLRFVEFRRRYFGEANLLFRYPTSVLAEPIQGTRRGRVLNELRGQILGGAN